MLMNPRRAAARMRVEHEPIERDRRGQIPPLPPVHQFERTTVGEADFAQRIAAEAEPLGVRISVVRENVRVERQPDRRIDRPAVADLHLQERQRRADVLQRLTLATRHDHRAHFAHAIDDEPVEPHRLAPSLNTAARRPDRAALLLAVELLADKSQSSAVGPDRSAAPSTPFSGGSAVGSANFGSGPVRLVEMRDSSVNFANTPPRLWSPFCR